MTAHTAFPDLLGRPDTDDGPWEVTGGRMGPGMAWTAIGDRRMSVPDGDTDNERAVRAHEMLHAKVSPRPEQMLDWLRRGRATADSLTVAEELRVNTLARRLGFAVDALTDGSETQSGEVLAQHNRWDDAVRSTCAFANTGRFKSFLVGVRRHNPEWAKTLRAFHDRLVKELAKVPSDSLASTHPDHTTGLSPLGYRWTEAVAVLVDGMLTPPPEQADDPAPGTEPGETPQADAPPVTPEQARQMTVEPSVHWWDDVRPGTHPRPRRAKGGIGRKRVPSPTGRNPRRMTRLTTDPYTRVFDRKVTGRGGVVLIDGSASMRMTPAQVMAVVDAAPGCTVLVYASNARARAEGLPNLWVLADRGTVADRIPDRPSGNGVDLPALRHALAARQRPDSPVVWVTDGAVHGPGQRYTDPAGIDCAKAVLAAGVVVRPNLEEAVKVLGEMAAGRRPARVYPAIWQTSWRNTFGRPIPGTR